MEQTIDEHEHEHEHEQEQVQGQGQGHEHEHEHEHEHDEAEAEVDPVSDLDHPVALAPELRPADCEPEPEPDGPKPELRPADCEPEPEPDGPKPEHEEGEISDEDEQALEDQERAEKSGSPAGSLEKDGPILQSKSGLLDPPPILLKPVGNSFSRWSGRVEADGRQHGWGWRTEPSAFSPQPDQFYQMAWQKGVQGSPKESAGDSPKEEAGNTMESLPRDFRGQEGIMRRYHTFRENSFRGNKAGDSDAAAVPLLHRSASWSANRDVDRSVSRKAGWLAGERGIEYASFVDRGRGDDGFTFWDEAGDRFEQRRVSGENWKGRTDKAFVFNKGIPERTITIKSTVEKVDREVSESEEKAEKQTGERNEAGSLQESLPSMLEVQPRIAESVRIRRDNLGKEEREEGELEEGEIEGGSSELIATIDTAEGLASNELGGEKQADRPSKGRERQFGKPSEKSYSQSNFKEWRHYDTSSHRHTTEYDRDRLLAECTELVRNVAVKDAQKSFIGVCKQLRSALKILRDLNKRSGAQEKHSEGHHRRVSSLARQVFSGIRAAYAVRNTASGKEQEQDKDLFPRLLELANGNCQKLFTSKQIRELESMMQTIGRHTQFERSQKVYSKDLPQFGTERVEEKDSKLGESSGNTSATTQLESESTTDTSANGRTLDFGDEAEQAANPSASISLIGGSSVDGHGMSADETPAASIRFGGWFPVMSEQVQTRDHANSIGLGPILPSMSASHSQFGGSRGFQIYGSGFNLEGKRAKFGSQTMDTSVTEVQEASSRNHTWPSALDPVSAVTSYHEKFAGKSLMAYTRLPSPTPSDEDEDARASDQLETPVSRVNTGVTEAQPVGPSQELQPTTAASILSFYPALDGAQQEAAEGNTSKLILPELKLFPSSGSVAIENGDIKTKTVFMPVKGSKKSRDPRRRLVNPLFDSEISQRDASSSQELVKAHPGDEGSRKHKAEEDVIGETIWSKRQHLQTPSYESSLHGGELLSLLTLATGGWLLEHPAVPNTTEGPTDMDVDNEGLSRNLDATNSLLENYPKRERQLDFLNQESWSGLTPSKRQKVEVGLKEVDDTSLAEGLLNLQRESAAVPSNDIKLMHTGDKVSQQTVIGSTRPATVLESSTAGDFVKPRMKPRDPRRVLLGSTSGKNENSGLESAKGDGAAATISKVVSLSYPQIAKKDIEMGLSTFGKAKEVAAVPHETSSPNFARNFTEKLMSLADMVVNSQSNLSTGSILSAAAESNGSAIGDIEPPGLNDSKNSSDDFARGNMVAVSAVPMVSVTRPSSKTDSNVSAGVPPKQREGPNHWDNLEHLLEGLDEKQRQAVRQERARRIEEQSRMFNARKLCLVLDLDHTLLNSAKFTEIEEEWEARLRANEAAERNRVSKEGLGKRELYRFPHMGMWTKLRPGIWNFLARASQLYELHVYTMGNKAYATEMAKLLDPTGTLFAGRVISKGDDVDGVDGDERLPKSKDLDGVLGMESAVVIIDDSARVWPHHRHNLIVVERYMYFPCSRRQFGLPGPSLLEVGHDEREADGMLASALMVIDKTHFSFFANQRLHEVDVRDILAAEQRRVLAGCKIIFSRVFPQGESQPQLHPLWQTAEQFGAVCTTAIDEEVTHVVAISFGTDKVNWAVATGRFVVRPAWLEASAILYRRANERDFPVPP